jgi:methionine-rich copper-binding protein CopC
MTDKTAPKLVSASLPKKGASAVPVGTDIGFLFNENIKVGTTGNITIINTNDINDTRVISVNSGEISTNGKTLTINPAKDLQPNSHYTVKIDNTAVQDSSGNKYAGIKNTTTLYFNTVDTLAPTLVKSSPFPSAPSVALNSNIVLTLSEKTHAGTGNITLTSGNDSRTIAITDKQVKISGTTLTINPSVDFNVASTYKLHLDAGTIKDLAPLNNNNKAIDLSFTTKATGDKQAPVLQSYAGNGFIGNKLQLAFQENIKIGKGSFTLVNSANNKDKIVIPVTDASVSITNNLLTIDLTGSTKIIPTNTYLLTAPKGIVTDLAKNAFAGLTTNKHISYHDETSPTITITDDKTTTTNSTILYTFAISEAVKDFTTDDIVVMGGTKGEFTTLSPTSYTLSVNPENNSTTLITNV